MAKAVFVNGEQKKFLEAVKIKTGLKWREIASLAGICHRSLCDWRREKNLMTLEAAKKLTEISQVGAPKLIKVLPEYWGYNKAAQAGGLARIKKYGNPGTAEGRRKGGLHTQELRRLFPEKYPRVIKRKTILQPSPSPSLAEFVGIVLGDGHLGHYQTVISLNSQTDTFYIEYVKELITNLFGVAATIRGEKKYNYASIVVSSVELTTYLLSIGLCRGNKVHNQVDIPKWIFENKEYMKACIRGLIDTDGTISRKNYHAKTLAMQIVLSNRSMPLLESARKILQELGFTPSRVSYGKQIYLTRKSDIQKYVKEVRFSNPKHLERYNKYLVDHY